MYIYYMYIYYMYINYMYIYYMYIHYMYIYYMYINYMYIYYMYIYYMYIYYMYINYMYIYYMYIYYMHIYYMYIYYMYIYYMYIYYMYIYYMYINYMYIYYMYLLYVYLLHVYLLHVYLLHVYLLHVYLLVDLHRSSTGITQLLFSASYDRIRTARGPDLNQRCLPWYAWMIVFQICHHVPAPQCSIANTVLGKMEGMTSESCPGCERSHWLNPRRRSRGIISLAVSRSGQLRAAPELRVRPYLSQLIILARVCACCPECCLQKFCKLPVV